MISLSWWSDEIAASWLRGWSKNRLGIGVGVWVPNLEWFWLLVEFLEGSVPFRVLSMRVNVELSWWRFGWSFSIIKVRLVEFVADEIIDVFTGTFDSSAPCSESVEFGWVEKSVDADWFVESGESDWFAKLGELNRFIKSIDSVDRLGGLTEFDWFVGAEIDWFGEIIVADLLVDGVIAGLFEFEEKLEPFELVVEVEFVWLTSGALVPFSGDGVDWLDEIFCPRVSLKFELRRQTKTESN